MKAFVLICACFLAGAVAAGDLERRYELTVTRVLEGGPPYYDQRFLLADVVPEPGRRFTEFSGDVSGRWLSALAYGEHGSSTQAALNLLPRILTLQKPDGHFGAELDFKKPTRDHMAMLWGNGRLLVGLLELHERTGSVEALQAARRLGDFLIRIAPVMNSQKVRNAFEKGQFAVGYICWTNNIEGLAQLFRITGHGPYRDLAEAIAGQTRFVPGQHSHGFLTSLRGVLALHEATGEARYLAQVEKAWSDIESSGNVLVTGAVPEYFLPEMKRTEGCSESDWLRLSLALWRKTGKMRYLEQAETTLFNEMALNQFASGDFGHRVLVGTGLAMGGAAQGQATAKAWWCCTLHGLRGFPDVRGAVFRVREGTIFLDLPTDGAVSDGGVKLKAESSLEEDGAVRVSVAQDSRKPVALEVRKPKWVETLEVRVNGAEAAASTREGYLRIETALRAGDEVEVRYWMKTQVKSDGKGRIAIFHGPWLLGVNEHDNPTYFDEPYQENRLLAKPDSDGMVRLEKTREVPSRPFRVRAARFEVGYLPGGYPMQPGRARLTAVAEQTGIPSVPWEYWFRLAEE